MRTVVLYFSRTGNTKSMAEAIANAIKAPAFDIASSEPEIVEDYDMVILGTPVEGFRPSKEALAFAETLPTTDSKKAILFCTYKLGKGSTFKALSKALADKGYNSVLDISKRGVKIGKTDFSDAIKEIQKVL
jgi:flavodoxin